MVFEHTFAENASILVEKLEFSIFQKSTFLAAFLGSGGEIKIPKQVLGYIWP